MKNLLNIPAGRFAGEEYQEYDRDEYVMSRNRFVTFWLWLGIIGSILGCIGGFMTASSYGNLGMLGRQLAAAGIECSHAISQLESASGIMMATGIIGSVCALIGYIMLLKWKKAGFWLLVVESVVLSCINMYAIEQMSDAYAEIGVYFSSTSVVMMQVGVSVVSWIILWAILQLKKNGVSCWSQLD